jgi:hypothetical protein
VVKLSAHGGASIGTYPSGAVMQRPDRGVEGLLIAKCIWEGRAFCHGRGHGGLEEVHGVEKVAAQLLEVRMKLLILFVRL